MGSFYGGGSIGGSGGSGGTKDYNELNNKPISNLIGSSVNNFVSLAGLDPGHYNLKGYYKKDSQSEVINATEPIELTVKTDSVTGKKVIQFFTVQDQIVYSNLIIYSGGLIEKEEKMPLIGGGSGEIYWGDMTI